jgi:hypothetical protein
VIATRKFWSLKTGEYGANANDVNSWNGNGKRGLYGLFAVFSGSLQCFIKRDFESFGGMKA